MSVDLAPSRRPLAPLRAQPQRPDLRRPWLRLLSEVLALAGPTAEFLRHGERPWASATFSGSRHTIALSFSGQEAMRIGETLIAALPDHEFTIPGHLVADATVVSVDHVAAPTHSLTIEIEVLLLQDA